MIAQGKEGISYVQEVIPHIEEAVKGASAHAELGAKKPEDKKKTTAQDGCVLQDRSTWIVS